jgi:hypothetical protein
VSLLRFIDTYGRERRPLKGNDENTLPFLKGKYTTVIRRKMKGNGTWR